MSTWYICQQWRLSQLSVCMHCLSVLSRQHEVVLYQAILDCLVDMDRILRVERALEGLCILTASAVPWTVLWHSALTLRGKPFSVHHVTPNADAKHIYSLEKLLQCIESLMQTYSLSFTKNSAVFSFWHLNLLMCEFITSVWRWALLLLLLTKFCPTSVITID